MEITSILGPIVGVGAVIATALVKHVPISGLYGTSAVIIVGVGTIGAMLTGYTIKDTVFSLKSLGLYINGPGHNAEALIADVERLASLARKDGFLALEKEVDKVVDDILRKGIRMLVDNTDPTIIQDVLEAEIAMMYEEEELAAKYWEDVGAFAPTVGIIGAVLGLMVVMLNLQDQSKIGPGIAAAFIATIYGVAIANLFALPAGKKLKRFCHHKKTEREIAAVGVLGIANSVSPKVLVERMKGMAH
jgi:chemotaxis protein MotA